MASNKNTILTSIVKELGLQTIWNSPLDTKVLCLQRFVRMFAYGSSVLVLVVYLKALGNDEARIGLFMTLTLWGDVVISFLLTMFADRIGRRNILAVGAVMMTASGVVFGLSSNFWLLLAAAIFGVISPSGNECGPFRAVEESTLACLTDKDVRADVFAWYIMIGTGGAALGLLTCGWTVGFLQGLAGWDEMRAYRMVFFGYAITGLIKFGLSLVLSDKVEAEPRSERVVDAEEAPLLGERVGLTQKKRFWSKVMPHLSHESQAILTQLTFLFALDSFASGLVTTSWVTYFFKSKFNMSDGTLGSLFFTTSFIAALSSLIAASLARRIGNINTMVFTHLPSAISLSLIPLPTQTWLSATFLILRSCTASMDSAPRSAFLAAIMLPNERTAVMGVLNLVKTFSQSLGPLISGLLFASGRAFVPFVVAGALKVTYDLGMLAVFKGHVAREDRAEGQAGVEDEREAEEEDDGLVVR